MAQIIRFYVPANFEPRKRFIPSGQRARVIPFPALRRDRPAAKPGRAGILARALGPLGDPSSTRVFWGFIG
ncbi:MAG TPA: hypothetical protein VFI72_05095 [Candidatus Angelobacter sp.]|nr:hypothetical protein [Candidatus Angelobacter sp.]